jgi:hypothetical protein
MQVVLKKMMARYRQLRIIHGLASMSKILTSLGKDVNER